MKKPNPFPVTPDNFIQCWEYVDKQRRTAKKKAAIAGIGGSATNLVFLAVLVFCTCGLLHAHLNGSFRNFWNSTFLFPFWQKVSEILLIPEGTLLEDIGILLSSAYLISIVLFSLLASVIWLLYHPFRKKAPTGTYEENTVLLHKLAQEARDFSYKTRISTSIFATVLTIITVFSIFLVYVIYMEDAQSATMLLSVFPTNILQANCLIYVLLLYLISNLFSSLLLLFTRPLYRYDFPYDFVVQTQRSAIYAREDDSTCPPENLAEKRREYAAKIREEALELEKEKAYSKAMHMLLDAAILSDREAMEHYARHCLLNRMNDSARYWLKQSIATGEASAQAKKMYLRMRLRLRHNTEYLKPEEAPPPMGVRICRMILSTLSFLWKMFVLLLFIASIALCALFFKANSDPHFLDTLPSSLTQMLDHLTSMEFDSQSQIPTEQVSPFEMPVMSLSVADTRWEHNCVAYDENNTPVLFCYVKEIGGDLTAPYAIGTKGKLKTAGLYTGNKWNLPSIKKHVTYLPFTQTIVISQDYLMSLEPGEYCIILDQNCYLPLLVYDTITFNSPQRGLSACGDENGWIINDLAEPKDITLSFYNLGDNTIRGLSQTVPLANSETPTVIPMDPQVYTISPDGNSVTIHADYLAQQEIGFYFGFQVRLANGDTLNTGHTYVGTVEGDLTGLLEITGKSTHSRSKGGDYTVQYQFPVPGTITYLSVHSDSQPVFIEETISDGRSEYIDPENSTITLPGDILKSCLTPGEYFHISVSYTTAHGQTACQSFHVKTLW